MKVKICGLTSLEDAMIAVECGASALGFIFYPSSKLFIIPSEVGKITQFIPGSVTTVGVFVNAPRGEILRTVERSGVQSAQIQGQEQPEDLQSYPFPVYKGFRVSPSFDVTVLARYSLPLILLDTFVEGAEGGTGKTFDWTVAAEATQYGRIMLAGGITPTNVQTAIKRARPYAVDICSGVESGVGKKDHTKMKALFSAIRATGAEEAKENRCLF